MEDKSSNSKEGLQIKSDDTEYENNDADYYLSVLFNIESSPGFKALEAISTKKDIPEERILRCKKEFQQLHAFLLAINAFEKSMSETLRNTLQEVIQQKLNQDRIVSEQFSGNAEIGELKRELLKAQNEVDIALERELKLQNGIEELSKTKQDLIHDIEEIRRHKADMLEPQLIAATKELKIDLLQRKLQVENLQKDMEEKQVSYEMVLGERDRLEAERERHSIALAKASETPIKILKQIDVLKDAILALSGENSKQLTLCQYLDKEIERLAKKKKDSEEMRMNQSAAYEERRGLIHQMEQQVDEIVKAYELAKEQLSFQKAEKIKREHDLYLRVMREKDSYLKYYRRLELSLNNIRLSIPTTIKQGADLRLALRELKTEETYSKKEIIKFRQIIDIQTLEYLKQDKTGKEETEILEEQLTLNNQLEEELEKLKKEATASSRNLESVQVERELKQREVIRSAARVRVIKNDNITKDIEILDVSKRYNETSGRVKEFLTLYEFVKNERNKYLNQIHSSSQRVTEMKEKIKILTNEIEILRNEISIKDRELSKKKQKNTANFALRDSLRNEANKLMIQYREKRAHIEHCISRIETLNANINSAEEDMLHLKARYEQNVRDRNMAGVHLLDRNDELCILYERINVQQEIMARGEEALNEKEDELRRFNIILLEFKRKIELEKQKIPKLTELAQKIKEEEEKKNALDLSMLKLGEQMENPDDSKRCRNLGGEDPSQDQLAKKIERLEAFLATQEERILEKDLILEEVTCLTERLKDQTIATKDETYMNTKEINELTKKIKKITRKTMAKVSELAMHQASAMSLFREKSEKECLLKEGLSKLEKGEIPIEDIQDDFVRIEKNKELRQARKENRQIQQDNYGGNLLELYNIANPSENQFYMHGKVKTTAEPRPNAYIPETSGIGQLPIPKPYGKYAPFKPKEPGSQLRHYKKPEVKPIEI